MNKVKMFFIAAALVLTTAGVFASKAKFANVGLYASNDGSHYYQLSSGGTLGSALQTTGSNQSLITDQTPSNFYGVYYFNNTTSTFAPAFAVTGIW